MALLHAPVQRRDTAVASRLIKYRVALGGSGKCFRVAVLFHLKGIEPGAQHEHELVAQNLTGGAQFAPIAMAFPQQPRLAVGTAIAEARKHQRDHGKPIKVPTAAFSSARPPIVIW